MFASKRRCFYFVPGLVCQYQVCLKCRKLVYESFSVNENSSAKSKKGVALTSDYICLQKMKKGTLFYQLALVATRRKRVPFFLSILLSLKNTGKGVKFQDITPIRATFTNTFAKDINNGYPLS